METQFVIGAIDQGTTSSRFIIFNHSGEILESHQLEHRQIYQQPGWCEHDPIEILQNVESCVNETLSKLKLPLSALRAVGITNQRETTVVWDKNTGKPLYNAIVWHDTRTAGIVHKLQKDHPEGINRFRPITGLPITTYFSAAKLLWLLENVSDLKKKAEDGEVLFGTIDSWLIWNLTGGVHITDVTNASRTNLMELKTLQWDEGILKELDIPQLMLPEIRSSSEVYGLGCSTSCIPQIPIAGNLGDQHAALFGQTCFEPGDAKNTYGTGCFCIMNTGLTPHTSSKGLLTTLGYKLGSQPAVYALEGSIAYAGSLIQWLRDNLKLFNSVSEVESLASAVDDNGGVYIVPAFSGLFAPHWRDDARGVMVGITSFVTREHIVRAALEATAFQTEEVVIAMEVDSGVKLQQLKVDGGMVENNLLMQTQSDLLNVEVVRPKIKETTALGAAYAAGLAVGFWQSKEELKENWSELARWKPEMPENKRKHYLSQWKKAVERTLNWEEKL